jgi:hypothetical protein
VRELGRGRYSSEFCAPSSTKPAVVDINFSERAGSNGTQSDVANDLGCWIDNAKGLHGKARVEASEYE